MEKRTSSSLKNPHFFQPLLPGFNNHINIPVKFFSKYIEGIHEVKTVNLRSDFSNRTWKVKMEGKMLTEGWKEFVEAHDLRVGDIVVFRHEGDLLFNVTVLGPSGCEIHYTQPPNHEESDESDSESEKEVEENMETEVDQVSSDLKCFSQTVTASNLSRDQVTVPQNFAKVNGFLNKERQEILLMNEEGKKWESEVRIFEACRLKIARGWRSFCAENKLIVGDSCKFRLVRDKDTVVFQLCSRSKAERNRFVKLTPTLSSLNLGKQHLPVSFTRENGLTNPGKIVMVDKNRTEWSMNLSVDSRNKMYIMNGNAWNKFCAANEVSAGESLTLELVRGGTCPVLKFVSKMERSPSEAEGRQPHKRARVERFSQEGRLKYDVGKKIVEEEESSHPSLKFDSKMERTPFEEEARPHKRARGERLNHDVGKKIFEKGESSRGNSAGDDGNLLHTQVLSIVDELKKMKQRFEDELTSNRRFKDKLVTMEENLEAALLLL